MDIGRVGRVGKIGNIKLSAIAQRVKSLLRRIKNVCN